jgi:hypothetical protein
MMRVGAQSVASDQALAEFRMRVAQLRRQRWRQIEYSEDPAEALLYMPDEGRDSFKGRGFAARSGGRQPTWRRVRVNDAGKVVTEDVDPPESPELPEPSEPESAPGRRATGRQASPGCSAGPHDGSSGRHSHRRVHA